MNLVLVKSHFEEELFFELMQELGGKVILPRNFQVNDTYKKFLADKIPGITDEVKDGDKGEIIYEVALPDHYVGFINYMLGRLRVSVIDNGLVI